MALPTATAFLRGHMAGVGFELNKLLAKQGYTGLLQAYGYAALIGSGLFS